METKAEWSFEYSQDPEYDGPSYPSLPMQHKRGISYTPPGWMRVYKEEAVPPKKTPKTDIDALFE